jgi:hypothetical protein
MNRTYVLRGEWQNVSTPPELSWGGAPYHGPSSISRSSPRAFQLDTVTSTNEAKRGLGQGPRAVANVSRRAVAFFLSSLECRAWLSLGSGTVAQVGSLRE